MSVAYIQQSAEHCTGMYGERYLFALRLTLALLLLIGIQATAVEVVLLALTCVILRHFDGPYNGGCDRMSILILCCLLLTHLLPTRYEQEVALGYLGLQAVLSYWISGWVKIVNPEWRNGRALMDVFAYSAYPVSEDLRRWSDHPLALALASWAVMLLELLFPLALLDLRALVLALILTASFHLANALVFGLNRFVWIWIATYPTLIWLQQRLIY